MLETLTVEVTAIKQQQILDKIQEITNTKDTEGFFLKNLFISSLYFSEAQKKNAPNSYKATITYARKV